MCVWLRARACVRVCVRYVNACLRVLRVYMYESTYICVHVCVCVCACACRAYVTDCARQSALF